MAHKCYRTSDRQEREMELPLELWQIVIALCIPHHTVNYSVYANFCDLLVQITYTLLKCMSLIKVFYSLMFFVFSSKYVVCPDVFHVNHVKYSFIIELI